MQDLMEIDSDALVGDKDLIEQTLESKMIMYQELGLENVISPEKYLFEIKRSQICKSNRNIKDDLKTSNQERPTRNNEFIDQISNEDLELIHKALVLLHVRSKTKEALEITKLLTKIAIWNENNIHSLLS
jgi:hypothetical protein